MLRKFRIEINNKEYIVKMEEIGAPQVSYQAAPAPAVQAAPAPIAAAPVAAPAPTQPAPTPVASGEGNTMKSPMPGNILDVFVKVGDVIEEGQTLLILEAMKMENEIVAPKAGTVAAVHVTKGTAANVGAELVTIA